MHECMIREAYGEQRELEMRSVSSLLIRILGIYRIGKNFFCSFRKCVVK